MRGVFKAIAPYLKALHYSEQFFVIYIILYF